MSRLLLFKTFLALTLVTFTALSSPFIFLSFHEYLHCHYSWHIQGGTGNCVITVYNNGFDAYAEVYNAEGEYMGLGKWEHPTINTISLIAIAIPMILSLSMFYDCLSEILYGKPLKKKRGSK